MLAAAKLTALTAAFFVIGGSGVLHSITQPLQDAQSASYCTVPADIRAEHPDLCG